MFFLPKSQPESQKTGCSTPRSLASLFCCFATQTAWLSSFRFHWCHLSGRTYQLEDDTPSWNDPDSLPSKSNIQAWFFIRKNPSPPSSPQCFWGNGMLLALFLTKIWNYVPDLGAQEKKKTNPTLNFISRKKCWESRKLWAFQCHLLFLP